MVFPHESDLKIEDLWPYFSDSNFFGKLGGLPKREYKEVNGQLHGKDPRGEWIEEWTWIDGVGVMQTHDFYRGIFRYFRFIVLFEETRSTYSLSIFISHLFPEIFLARLCYK